MENLFSIVISFAIYSEEAIVMANLRKRVAACDLKPKRVTTNDARCNEPDDDFDDRPLLSKVRLVFSIFVSPTWHSNKNTIVKQQQQQQKLLDKLTRSGARIKDKFIQLFISHLYHRFYMVDEYNCKYHTKHLETISS